MPLAAFASIQFQSKFAVYLIVSWSRKFTLSYDAYEITDFKDFYIQPHKIILIDVNKAYLEKMFHVDKAYLGKIEIICTCILMCS